MNLYFTELLIFYLIEVKDDICRDDVRRQYFHNSSYVKKYTYVPHLVLFVLALIKKVQQLYSKHPLDGEELFSFFVMYFLLVPFQLFKYIFVIFACF